MLSNCSLTPVPLSVPYPDSCPEEDFLPALDFDDILDIAKECEFTRTITHLWPCEESSELGLEDILATIVPTPCTEESPLPLSSSTLSMNLDSNLPRVDPHWSTSICPTSDSNAGLSRVLSSSPQIDDQAATKMKPPITSILGWSPPNGSQFLDLEANLMLPCSSTHEWVPPRLVTCLELLTTQSVGSIGQSPTVSEVGSMQPHLSEAKPNTASAASKTDEADDNLGRKGLPQELLLAQPFTRAILEPVRARSGLQANSSVRNQMTTIPHAKTTKPRLQLFPVPGSDNTSPVTYPRAPRGGIPPHIARTVTKANILRMEKERKVMQDAFSSASTGEGKKPSVLRKTVRGEREMGKEANGGDSGRESFGSGKDEKGGREAKRARL